MNRLLRKQPGQQQGGPQQGGPMHQRRGGVSSSSSPRSGDSSAESVNLGARLNAANQRKPFLFGILLGATVAYSLSALSESIRLSHSIHHYVHHQVSDFNLLGIVAGGGGGSTSGSAKKKKKKKRTTSLTTTTARKTKQQEEKAADSDDEDEEEEEEDGKDITDDELLENLKKAKGTDVDDALDPRKPHLVRRPMGAANIIRTNGNHLQSLQRKRAIEAAAREGGQHQAANPMQNVKPKKQSTFDERMAANHGKQPPEHPNARTATVSYRLDVPIPKETLEQLGLVGVCDAENNVLKLDAGEKSRKICLQGKLPQYSHPPPLFLPDTKDRDIFMIQPENKIALQDDWVNWSWQTCITLRSGANHISGRVATGGVESFQHFHDNAIGLVYQMRHAYDFIQRAVQPCKFTKSVVAKRPGKDVILFEEWELMGFPSINKMQKVRQPGESDVSVEITFFPQDFDQVRVHPVHVHWLQSKFPPERPIDREKVIFVSRQGSNRGDTGRQFKKEGVFLNQLRKRIPTLVYFHPGKEKIHTVDGLRDLLGDACMIFGLHGGHMYNQYFASSKTAVLEMVAVDSQGLFHNQKDAKARPTLAHRAFWQSANLINQPYWRVHFETPKGTYFEVDDGTIDRIFQVASRVGCAVTSKAVQ